MCARAADHDQQHEKVHPDRIAVVPQRHGHGLAAEGAAVVVAGNSATAQDTSESFR